MVHAFTELGLLVFVCVQHFQQHFSYILSQNSPRNENLNLLHGPKQILDLSLYKQMYMCSSK